MSQRRNIIVCRDLRDLSRRAAEEFSCLVKVAGLRRFTVAVAGGSTPKGLYSLLAGDDFRGRVPWPQVHLFWGDERCVPPDHPDSNYRMVQESLISRVPIPEENVYRMEGEGEPKASASRYEAALTGFFQLSDKEFPRFDLVLLGLGEDGHTASLFPGSGALRDTERLVTAVYVEKLKSYRLTLTFPVLDRAAHVFFLVAGKSKAKILREVLFGEDGPERYPAQRVKPRDGSVVWFVDEAAAGSCREMLQP